MAVTDERQTATILFIAVSLFAVSSWVDINGLWTEIPLLVNSLPEGWNLPSYVVVIIQIANVAPLSYLVVKRLKPGIVREWIAVCVIIGIGIVSSFLLIFTWDKTSVVGERQHSTALFVLSFFLATVDCTSSLVYLPYMARFKSPSYMTALYVGEGFSGLIPALIGLVQVTGTGVDKNSNLNDGAAPNVAANLTAHPDPRFSVSAFFFILFLLLVVSLASFLFINFNPRFNAFKIDRFRVGRATESPREEGCRRANDFDSGIITCPSTIPSDKLSPESSSLKVSRKRPALASAASASNVPSEEEEEVAIWANDRTIGFSRTGASHVAGIYFMVAWINALCNGLLPSVQSYSCLPYGDLAYNLAVKLSIVVNPLVCFLTLYVTVRRLRVIVFLSVLGSLMAAYHLSLAALSPDPVLKDEISGVVLVILSSVLMSACFSYSKVSLSRILAEAGGERLLLNCGALTQAGSLVGAVVGFLLVNVFRVFKNA